MSMFSNVSYLIPRDPSIIGPGRPLPVSRKCLNSFFAPEDQVKDPVQVYLRIKPLPPNDGFRMPEATSFAVPDPKTLVTKHFKTTSRGKSQVTQQYSFSEIFNGDCDQKQIFEKCAQESVRDFVSGKNALMFAYGTTNAGKTHTMMGSISKPGIIPRSINIVFNSVINKLSQSDRLKPDKVCSVIELDHRAQLVDAQFKRQILEWSAQASETSSLGRSTLSHASDSTSDSMTGRRAGLDLTDDSVDFISHSFREMQSNLHDETAASVAAPDDLVYAVWISFAEIYNENIYDLLVAPAERKVLGLGLDGQNNVYIKGLHHVCVRTGDEAYQVLLYGQNNLRCAPTNLNSTSSRSHCIFTIKLVRSPNTDAPTHAGVSSFSFCDLAGSERVKKTMNAGSRLKESQNINNSLVVLGRCITNIRDNQKLKAHDKKPIPFRDSKLTRLFQRALLGHERVSMMVNVSTEHVLFSETANVLTFSAIARQILLEPLGRKKKQTLSTRFSVIAAKHSKRQTIAWAFPDDEFDETAASLDASKARDSIAVSRLVAQLRRELEDEKRRNLTIETQIREELADKFTQMLQEVDDSHKRQLQDMESRQDNMTEWRLTKMQEYYGAGQRSAKRRRSGDDDLDTTVTSCVTESTGLTTDVDHEMEALQELNADAVETNRLLKIDNSKLQFELADLKSKLLSANKIIDVARKSPEQDQWNPLINELRTELATEKANSETLNTLLNEAKMEFENFKEQNATLERDLLEAERELADKELAFDELTLNLGDCSQLLAEKTELLEAKEHDISQLNSTIAELRSSAAPSNHKDLLATISKQEQEIKRLQELIDLNDSLAARNKSLIENVSKSTSQLSDALTKENETLRERVSTLEDELKSHETCEERNEELGARVRHLDEKLAALQDANSTMSSVSSGLESDYARKDKEVTELEKEVKNQLRLNMSKGDEVRALERELKETVKAMNRAETERLAQEDKVKQVTIQWQCEINSLQAQLQAEKDNVELVKRQAEDMKKKEMATVQEENDQLADKIAAMTADMASFEERRDKQFKHYEDMLQKKRDEVDCHKREVKSLQEVLYKNTPTPKKDQVNQLKEDVRLRDQKINELVSMVEELNVNKTTQSKENSDPVVTASAIKRRVRQTKKANPTPVSCTSSILSEILNLECTPFPLTPFENQHANKPVIKEEPVSSEKKGRTRKKLFTQKDDLIELPSAPSPASDNRNTGKTPADLMRTLRSRRN